jgi:hypothetical protein
LNPLSASKSEEGIFNMRLSLLVLLSFVVLTAQKCDDSANHVVEINLTQTESYCGGAAPPDELIKHLNTPKPFIGKRAYVFNDLKACVDSFYPTHDTMFKTALKQGDYTVHLVPELLKTNGMLSEDERCLMEFKQRVVSMFEISGDTSLTVNIYFGCNPCLEPPP